MGIKCLNRYLRNNCPNSIKTIPISELNGKKIAVDISIYLYKYESENTLIENIYLLLSILRYYNITPIFIFDGKAPSEKTAVIQQRITTRKDAEVEYKDLKEKLQNTKNQEEIQDITESMDQLKKKIVYITKHKVSKVKELITAYGSSYYDAWGEADELCALLVMHNHVWACLSEDMDMFVYGCTRVIRYFSLINHTAVLYCTKSILNELQLTQIELRHICILSGTDYNVNSNKKNTSLFDIMVYFKKYKQTKMCHQITFYSWLSDNTKDLHLDASLWDHINHMFDISDHSQTYDYKDIKISSSPVNYLALQDILYSDGFIFIQ
uniref:XPG N-terminal domain-containing protein n=1 Tax=viral metagenome TaxID=1070528 RepID=A0A6C0E3C9_9ZZZZ